MYVEIKLHDLRLSRKESLRCGHSCEIYIYIRMKSETELGRESQEWPRVYESNNMSKRKSELCVKRVRRVMITLARY